MDINFEEIRRKIIDRAREEAVLSTLDGLVAAAEDNDKDFITIDEIQYMRNLITGDTDEKLEDRVNDNLVQMLLDQMYQENI